MIALGGVGLVVGLLAVLLAAHATAAPINLRRALGEVQGGDFDGRIPVYDGTQIGQLQRVNQMAEGLEEGSASARRSAPTSTRTWPSTSSRRAARASRARRWR